MSGPRKPRPVRPDRYYPPGHRNIDPDPLGKRGGRPAPVPAIYTPPAVALPPAPPAPPVPAGRARLRGRFRVFGLEVDITLGDEGRPPRRRR